MANSKNAVRGGISLFAMLAAISPVSAQDISPVSAQDEDIDLTQDVIVVQGIRASLASALDEKRAAPNLIEVIQAEDIGKLPDQNLAEVLENITGIQITREAGVGTAVQIRGTNANRVEINGVSTVGSGSGRSGISFEDLPSALISSVEVVKVPTAQTIEGSVGGTINLRTLRGLDLNESLLAIRAQGEYSDLTRSTNPRVSATAGKSWSTDVGEFGVVLSGSYFQQDVSFIRPRFDRDRDVLPGSGRASAETFPFLRTQFLAQDNDNIEFETYNFTGSLEYAPSEDLKFYFDATVNDQERATRFTSVGFSGTGANSVVDATTNTSFDTIDLGSVEGPNGTDQLGEVQAVLTGFLDVGANPGESIDPNLRATSESSTRSTDSNVFALGGEWRRDRLSLRTEGAISTSNSRLPIFLAQLDFINPNGPQPILGISVDNAVPVEFDASNGILQFGIADGRPFAPSSAELLDVSNYALRFVRQTERIAENREVAARFDLSYDTADLVPFFTSIDLGYRYNNTSALRDNAISVGNLSNATDSFNRPTADLFAEIITPGPSNFDRGDDRTLFVSDFLIVDPDISASNPQAVLDAFNTAITQNNAATTGIDVPLISMPTQTLDAFFDIEEKTHAAYFQANFDTDNFGVPVRGDAGIRYVSTDLTSLGFNVVSGMSAGNIVQNTTYDFFLPRINLAVHPTDELILRGGVSRDIRRPNFDDLSTSITFPNAPDANVVTGNPSLVPEVVWSYDGSLEYYFSPASIVSVGFFHKSRTNLFADSIDSPANPTAAGGQIERDITPPCEEGGIFNPVADRNVFSSIQGVGICAPLQSTFNVDGSTTQTGVEAAFQYDLSNWEDRLGWASGFGFIGNVTFQTTGGSAQEFRTADGDANALNNLLGRTGANVVQDRVGLLDLSKWSYNATLFYEKYGVTFRARYTWRSDFQIDNFVSFGLPSVVGDRGQLNASLSYAINDNISVGVEAVNLLKTDRPFFCVNDDALLCNQGIADRRLIGGINLRF